MQLKLAKNDIKIREKFHSLPNKRDTTKFDVQINKFYILIRYHSNILIAVNKMKLCWENVQCNERQYKCKFLWF
jgi:hypothetical protein